MEIWGIANQIIKEHPIFGVGLSVYNYEHRLYARASAATEIGFGTRDAHSTFLKVAAETGYLGFLIFMIPFVLAIARSHRVRTRFGRMFPARAQSLNYLEAGLIAYLVCGLFGSYAHTIYLWLSLGLLSMVTEDLRRVATRAAQPPIRRGPMPSARPLPGRPIGAIR